LQKKQSNIHLKNIIMKKLLLFTAMSVSITCTSQIDPPVFHSDSIFDTYGKKYHINEITVKQGGLMKAKGQSPPLPMITCGYFELYFETGSGMEGTSSVELSRRNVVCQVFTDLSNWINSPLSTNPNPLTNKAKIFVRQLSALGPTVGIAGYGGAFLPNLPNSNFNSAYTWDNTLWQTINTGYNSYYHNAYPINNNMDLYHAFVAFNFDPSLPFAYHYNLGTGPAAGDMDFYSLVLHEATHALGFLSFINHNGTSVIGGTTYYSRYDNFLNSGFNGLPLIEQLAGCGPKFIRYNPNTPSYNTLSPGQPGCGTLPATAFQPNTNCATAVRYNSSLNTNVPAHTPPCYCKSSLSHFEDQCSPWFNNDLYFVMSNVSPTGAVKRYLKPEERNVICDLGYNTNSTFGTVSNLNFINYGSSCSNRVAGVNDGVINRGQYNIITNVGVPTSNIFPLSNDVNASSFTCMQIVFGAGSISNTFGTSFAYTPTMPGLHLLQYVPVSPSGKKGNMTYVYIFVRDNCPVNCSITSNGGFENSTSCGSWYDNAMGASGSGVSPYLYNIACWTPNNGTPDLYVRNCNSPFFGTGYNVPVTGVNTHDFPNPGNNKFLGFVASEGIQNQLASPLVPGMQYQLSFKALKFGTAGDPEMLVVASALPSGMVGIVNVNNMPSFYTLISNYTISSSFSWTGYSTIFTYNGPANANYVSCFGSAASLANGLMLDDFNIVEVGTPNAAASFTLPANMCANQTIANLISSISPTTALALGGYFTGPGIQNNGGVWSLNLSAVPAGPQNYAFVYTNPMSGCTYTTNSTVNVFPSASVTASAAPNPVCINLGQTSTSLSGSASLPLPAGVTYTWNPGNVTGQNVPVNISTATVYTVSVALGCTVTNTVAVQVSSVCCPASSYPIVPGNFLTGGATLTGNYVVNQSFTVGANPGSSTMFENGEFLIAKDAKITVLPGHELRLRGVHMYACSADMWTGIELMDGANLVGYTGAIPPNDLPVLIEDAKVAIDLSNISAPFTPYPINLSNVVFNKNHTGIKISNSPLSSLSIFLNSCVFTSRNFVTSSTQWPNTLTWGGLRAVVNPTTGLSAPYNIVGSLSNMKSPYSTHPGFIGIQIENIGNVPGAVPNPGVQISGNPFFTSEYNIFDGIGRGIDVTDANLTTSNNIFQRMQNFNTSSGPSRGRGISHRISGLMNAGLYLSPASPNATNPDFGNRFWDCYEDITAENVYEMDVQYNIFRSTQSTSGSGGFAQGFSGISATSNRFQYEILNNDFNNINYPVKLDIQPGPYDMGWGVQNGVYAGPVDIKQNYMGAQINSTTSLGGELVTQAISVAGPNNIGLSSSGALSIYSNKMDRVYNGIYLWGLDSYPVEVLGNIITLADDLINNSAEKGIEVTQTVRSVAVIGNTLTGTGKTYLNAALIYCEDNQGPKNPVITCNDVSLCYEGFDFSLPNPGLEWMGNKMQNLGIGLHLSNGCFINSQGNPFLSSANEWNGTWATPDFCTYASGGSMPTSSSLYVDNGAPYVPFLNGGATMGIDYNMPGAIQINGWGTPLYSCPTLNLPAPPAYRVVLQDLEEMTQDLLVDLFPNPSSGHITIVRANKGEGLEVRITDVNGKMVYDKALPAGTSPVHLDLGLEEGLYLMELKSGPGTRSLKKLVITR
jgi:hypothetical protein